MSEIKKEIKIQMLKKMVEIRLFETKIVELVDLYEIVGPVHTCIGQEAEIVGTCMGLSDNDYIMGNHRSHGYMIAKGSNMKNLMAEIFGKITGVNRGKGGSMHLSDKKIGSLGATGIVGSGIPIVCGSALTSKIKNDGRVSVVFFGDGAANEGVAHEAMNLASIWKLPVIFLLENNGVAVTMTKERSSNIKDLYIRAESYGMYGTKVDGQNPEEVYNTVLNAIECAKNGKGPTLIEAKTYRFREHAEGNAYRNMWQKEYRSLKENKMWLEHQDPITMYKNKLIKEGIISDTQFNEMEKEITIQVIESVEYAQNSSFPNFDELYKHVFSE